MEIYEILAWAIVGLPLASFALQLAFGKRLPRQGDWLPTGAIWLALFLGIVLFIKVIVLEYDPNFLYQKSYLWFGGAGMMEFHFGFHIDNLTAVMIMVVNIVSALVHLFSIGYMRGEDCYDRYFAYLSLFSFSMLLLVLCDNIFVLYITWELVGVSSYLLIGFFFWKNSAANACMKAFLTTRVGDVFMFLGIMILVREIGVLNYTKVFEAVGQGQIHGTLLSIAAVCLFGGAVGKSAQFPLHVWLPDAMEGPTPVSALIHAATMVAAGVYMVGRLFPIFSASHEAMLVIAYIGLITAVFAATIAITQTDIKRVLAYSTVSQLGYMITALGVGAFTAGLYHLMTHAFFKALLFLGSGSVIHAVHSQEMPDMGGLKKKLPITWATMLIATLAISGVPFFSGFGSKDAILAGALAFGMENPAHMPIFIGLWLAAGVTAFYMFRLIFLTFYGEPRIPEKFAHAHESPSVMTIPLITLAVLSVLGGFGLYGGLWFNHLIVAPGAVHAAGAAAEHGGESSEHLAHYLAMVLSIVIAFSGIFLSYLVYSKKKISAAAWAAKLRPLYDLSFHKYWVDEFYEKTAIRFILWIRMVFARFDNKVIDGLVNITAPGLRGTSAFSGAWDKYVVDGLVNLLAIMTQIAGSASTLIQSGVIQNYILKASLAAGAVLLLHNYLIRLFV